MREDSVKTTRYRITRTNFSKRKCTKQADDGAHDPRDEKDFRYPCLLRHFYRGPKDAHANHQTHHNHGEIKLTEFRFYRQVSRLKSVHQISEKSKAVKSNDDNALIISPFQGSFILLCDCYHHFTPSGLGSSSIIKAIILL
jgi:hypothetical protein